MRGFRSHIGWKTFGQSSIRAWTPLNVVVIQIAGGIRITWTNNPSATETEIWVSQDGAAYALVYTAGTGVATYDYTCDVGSTYNVELRSKIDSTVLNAPNTIATAVVGGGIQITWNDNNTSADHIEVWCNIAGAGYTLIATVLAGDQTYTHAATLGNDNIYKVRAKEGTLPVYSSYSATSEIVYVISPTIATTTPSSITSTTASSGGNISNAGGHTISARGVCWKTSSGATPSDSHTSDGSGTGTFTSSLTGLTAATLYYIRAYATTPEGTFYGDEQTFNTPANTSYANTGGTGNRTSIIDVTTNVVMDKLGSVTPPEGLVNGVTSNADFMAYGTNANLAGLWINFDLKAGVQKIINEMKYYQNAATVIGIAKIQGSNEASSTPSSGGFTDLTITFTLGGVANPYIQTITALASNITAYRHYRLVFISGSTTADAFTINEFEFKISP